MTEPVPTNPLHIVADPSKAFFIDMLTKDISLAECVLDLIDNAVDKALERSQVSVMELLERGTLAPVISGARISIDFTATRFTITDTCGGIGLNEARFQVFRFGNPDERHAEHGLSVYGIGMKRAFFKLGKIIQIHSQTATEAFDITINVANWKRQPDWSFVFDNYSEQPNESPYGTQIVIPELREGVGDRLAIPTFEIDLRKRIGSTYALFLTAGIEITINGTPVPPRLPTLIGDPFHPAVQKLDRDDVQILIIAGLSPKDDRTPHGWYIFCNGRMVVEADKTSMTGWGEGFPAFHSKFNHFVGLVLFDSADVHKLPWKTTKQGVEKESPIYQVALNEMQVQARPVITFLNELYPSDIEPEGVEEARQMESSNTVGLQALSRAGSTSTFSVRRGRTVSSTVTIQYLRPRELVSRIGAFFGDRHMPAYRVGENTFDYFVQNELG
jgi:hypothetical protein